MAECSISSTKNLFHVENICQALFGFTVESQVSSQNIARFQRKYTFVSKLFSSRLPLCTTNG